MKKIASFIIAICMVFANIQAFAQKDVTVNFNGEKLDFDVDAFILEDRTMVPMRAIFEAVGAKVSWDNDTKTVIAAYQTHEDEQKFVVLQIGNNVAFVNSEQKTLDAPAVIVEERTFVPLRFVMEELGCKVEWNPNTYTVDINAE